MRRFMTLLGIAAFSLAAQVAAASHLLTVAVEQKPALTLQLPDDWSTTRKADKTSIDPGRHEVHIQIWPVAGAKTVQDVIPKVAQLINSEVTEYKAEKAENMTLAGAPARHIIGTGSEADDGDPSNVEVYLFNVGGQVFLLCAHGEGQGAAMARGDIARMLATARKP